MVKRNKYWYGPIATDVRLTLYGILLAVGIYFVFFDQSTYYCNRPGEACPFCGLKTALYHLLHLRFAAAHQTNPYVWILAALGIAMVMDAGIILARFIKINRKL